MKRKSASSPNRLAGHIHWFDPTTGRGSIISDEGVWYRIHEFSEIQRKKRQTLKEKTRIEFELAKDSLNPIVKTIRPIEVEAGTNKEHRVKHAKA